MQRYVFFLFKFCILTVFADASAAIQTVDDRGNEVVLTAPATRIVSLAPHLTEILFELGVGDKIVGTVKYSDYPEAAKKIARLGDAFSLNIESVLALHPDIIFAWHTGGINRPIERLRSLGIPVYVNESETLESIADGLARIGLLVGAEQRGLQLQTRFINRLAALKVTDVSPQPRVFFQISDQDLYTVSDDHLIGQGINHCGGSNLFADITPDVTLVSKEVIVAAQPDLILLTQSPSNQPSPWIKRWSAYDGFEDKIKTLDPGLISRPSFRMLEGLEVLCGLISGQNG